MDSPAPLRLRGPSLAAQAWTTVWTPDSAPALRTAGTDADDHDSKTNCYPCKVWDKGANSGKGGWTPLPATTEPIICAGDTNDYTCKECDGTGGVRNKADDSDCFINEKSGKCCEGVCIEIPSEGTDPCLWAAGNDDFRNDHAGFFQPVTGPEGFTICIFGEPYPCVPPDNIPQAWKWANIDTCVERHEQYHVDHSLIQCPPCGTGIGTYADEATEREEECCAFFDTLLCLNELLNADPNDQNRQTIDDVIQATNHKMLVELTCWGGSDVDGIQQTPVTMPCN